MEPKKYYNKEDDVFSIMFGEGYEHSRELEDCKLIVDFDKEGEIVGIEIFDLDKKFRESQVKIEKIFDGDGNKQQGVKDE